MMYLVVSIIKQKKTITFYRNGVSLGVAYTNIDKKVPLYPAIDFSTQGSEIDIVKPKFKKEKRRRNLIVIKVIVKVKMKMNFQDFNQN